MESFLPLLVPLGVLFWVTPIAIVAWLVLRRRNNPRADLSSGFVSLVLWCIVPVVLFLTTDRLEGNTLSMWSFMPVVLISAVNLAILWVLYFKIGVRERPPQG